MTPQPEALLLAIDLDGIFISEEIHATKAKRIAAELRRLHEAHEWQHKMAGERLRRIEKLEAELERAVLAERRACANVCDARYMGDNNREDMEARRCAEAIRARGAAPQQEGETA